MAARQIHQTLLGRFAVALVASLLLASPAHALEFLGMDTDDVFAGSEDFTLQSMIADPPEEGCPDPMGGIKVGGWTQFGYHNASNGVFNTHPDRVNLHQQWLYVEKVADGSKGFDWGFRGDVMYGVDAANTQAFGSQPGTWDFQNGFDHGIYGWALPQLYAEFAYGDLSVKAGHFFTIIGYEVVTAPDNFFYSHAFTMNFNEPFTHTGVLATYKVNDGVTVYGGWTAGWDTGFDDFNDGDNSDGSNFLGGVTLQLTDNMSATWALTAGDLGWKGEGYSHSVVVDYQITEKINYVFQSDLVETNSAPGNHSWSWNNYLFYTINDTFKAGMRMEWWKVSSRTMTAFTAGVNIRPTKNFVIRPEIRWQTGDTDNDEAFFGPGLNRGGQTLGGFGIPVNPGTIIGVDAILTY